MVVSKQMTLSLNGIPLHEPFANFSQSKTESTSMANLTHFEKVAFFTE